MKRIIICLLSLTSVAYGAVYSDFARLVDYQSDIHSYGEGIVNTGEPDYVLEFCLPPMDYDSLSRDWQLDHENWDWEIGYTGRYLWSYPNSTLGIEPPVLTPHSTLYDRNYGDRLERLADYTPVVGGGYITEYEPFPVSGSFYFGTEFNTDGGLGWVQLDYSAGSLQILSSAIAVNHNGIIVGTTQAIPEPSSAVLIAVVSGFGWFVRRHFPRF